MRVRRLWVGAVIFGFWSCGGRPASKQTPTLSLDQSVAACVAFRSRQRTCSEPYLDRITEISIRYPKASSYGDEAKSPGAFVTIRAKEAALFDGLTDEATAHDRCQAALSQPQVDASHEGSQMATCTALVDCKEFVSCAVKDLEKNWAVTEGK